jgi:hypothetical protein
MAFGLFNLESGQMVLFDDCQDATGNMQEYKGHYEDLMAKEFFTKDILRKDFLEQASSQIEANDFRNLQTGRDNWIDWHFDEMETAGYAWNLFEAAGYLDEIRIYYTPYGRHTSERYPDPD